jgi:hypothetical protein
VFVTALGYIRSFKLDAANPSCHLPSDTVEVSVSFDMQLCIRASHAAPVIRNTQARLVQQDCCCLHQAQGWNGLVQGTRTMNPETRRSGNEQHAKTMSLEQVYNMIKGSFISRIVWTGDRRPFRNTNSPELNPTIKLAWSTALRT